MNLTITVALFLLNIILVEAVKVSCKNEENQDVDWFYLYKLPQHYSNEIDSDQSGLRYSYLTEDSIQRTNNWKLSDLRIDNFNSFPGRTLKDLYNDPEILLIFYNDEVPDGPTDNKNGHTKGVVATDGAYAIWLAHSVPKFPKFSEYSYPSSGEHYGQSFLCITLNATTQMNSVVTQLLFNEPNIYFSRIPEKLSQTYPGLSDVIAKKWRSEKPFESLLELTSLNGSIFKSFAKGRHSNVELYKDWVAPLLDVDLMVETWRNDAGKLPSDCTKKDKVYNIVMIDDREPEFSFKSTSDHSKWAVSKRGEDDWICIGDINRSEHQLIRGGGTLCQKNSKLAQLYQSLIGGFENCTHNNSFK